LEYIGNIISGVEVSGSAKTAIIEKLKDSIEVASENKREAEECQVTLLEFLQN